MAARAFLEQVRTLIRLRQLSYRTEQTYCDVITHYIRFHGKRHPAELGPSDVCAYLTYLVCDRHLSASSQHVALCALHFLYRHVLDQPLPMDLVFPAATKPPRLPVVFTRAEVQAILSQLEHPALLQAQLLYGAGLRIMECLRLRIKDVDIPQRQITVRQGKGGKDRVTMLPALVVPALQQQLAHSRRLHALDLAEGYGAVELPDALVRKYPQAAYAWAWQYVFPAEHRSRDPRSGVALAGISAQVSTRYWRFWFLIGSWQRKTRMLSGFRPGSNRCWLRDDMVSSRRRKWSFVSLANLNEWRPPISAR
jgi:integron integrase